MLDDIIFLEKNIPGGIRTHNPLIRSQMPYPLGHGDYFQ